MLILPPPRALAATASSGSQRPRPCGSGVIDRWLVQAGAALFQILSEIFEIDNRAQRFQGITLCSKYVDLSSIAKTCVHRTFNDSTPIINGEPNLGPSG